MRNRSSRCCARVILSPERSEPPVTLGLRRQPASLPRPANPNLEGDRAKRRLRQTKTRSAFPIRIPPSPDARRTGGGWQREVTAHYAVAYGSGSAYSTTTSSGNRKVVAPSSNCTNSMRRPRLSTERRMRGFSLNLLSPSWSRTGLSKRQTRPITVSKFVLSMFITVLPPAKLPARV
jgi:hypothetical protein